MTLTNKHKLIIHIGTPKTGTSALQRFLYENESLLNQYQYTYPRLIDIANKTMIHKYQTEDDQKYKPAQIFSRCIIYPGAKTDNQCNDWKILWRILKDCLKKHNTIISEESIWWWDTESFLRQAKNEYDNIYIVVYLRRQDRFIESCWNQNVKRYNFCSDDFSNYLNNKRNDKINQYLNKLEQIESIFGKEHMHVRVYEKEQFEGERHDIISDFLSIFNICPNWETCCLTKSENESLSGNFLEIKRIMNSVLKDKNRKLSRDIEQCYLNLFKQMDFSSKKSSDVGLGYYMSIDERTEFINSYSKENEMIAKKYLGRNDGILFKENITSIPQSNLVDDKMYEDIIKIFTQLICYHSYLIKNLK